ncbi:MAG: alpha-isopropylmalate synthase regulatory domain-containing protein, partial [Bacteroidota bacterium]
DLEDYLIQSSINRSYDTAKVHVKVKHQNQSYVGFGVDTDIVTASVLAYLDAINKITALTVNIPIPEEEIVAV